jgi:hypothetical protein
MSAGAIVFMALSWGFVLGLVLFCLSHFFRQNRD